MYLILVIIITTISWFVSENLKRKSKKYSLLQLGNGLSGKTIAEKMLYDHRIYDVKIIISEGMLTDYYNPINKTISLSKNIYEGTNVLAAAVAAHETGHAIQHATYYLPLSIRSALIPAVNFSARFVQWVILIGLFLIGSRAKIGMSILLVGIGLFTIITIFSFITLPVEINASVRALDWLNRSRIIHSNNYNSAKGALKAAAYTYVVAAFASLASLLYYILTYVKKS